MNETVWPLVGEDDGAGRWTVSTGLVVTVDDDDAVDRSFFVSPVKPSKLAGWSLGDGGVRTWVAWSMVPSLWWVIDDFEHWKISFNCRRNNDEVAE